MDRATLKTRLTAKLMQESSLVLHDATARETALQIALDRVTLELDLGRASKSGTLPSPAGTYLAFTPAELGIADTVSGVANEGLIIDGRKLKRIQLEDYRMHDPFYDDSNEQFTGDPEYYAWDGEKLHIFPFSSSSLKYVLFYLKRSVFANDSDVPWSGKYPEWHSILVTRAAWELYEDKGPQFYQNARYWELQYRKELEEFRLFLDKQRGGSSRIVMGNTQIGDRGWSGWRE